MPNNLNETQINTVYLALFSSFITIENKDNIPCMSMRGLGKDLEYSLSTLPNGDRIITELASTNQYLLKATEYGFVLFNSLNKLVLDFKATGHNQMTSISIDTGDIFLVQKIDHNVRIINQFTEETVPAEMVAATC